MYADENVIKINELSYEDKVRLAQDTHGRQRVLKSLQIRSASLMTLRRK